jgi:hypothetical protein
MDVIPTWSAPQLLCMLLLLLGKLSMCLVLWHMTHATRLSFVSLAADTCCSDSCCPFVAR